MFNFYYWKMEIFNYWQNAEDVSLTESPKRKIIVDCGLLGCDALGMEAIRSSETLVTT
jgi:hypothetical protein